MLPSRQLAINWTNDNPVTFIYMCHRASVGQMNVGWMLHGNVSGKSVHTRQQNDPISGTLYHSKYKDQWTRTIGSQLPLNIKYVSLLLPNRCFREKLWYLWRYHSRRDITILHPTVETTSPTMTDKLWLASSSQLIRFYLGGLRPSMTK